MPSFIDLVNHFLVDTGKKWIALFSSEHPRRNQQVASLSPGYPILKKAGSYIIFADQPLYKIDQFHDGCLGIILGTEVKDQITEAGRFGLALLRRSREAHSRKSRGTSLNSRCSIFWSVWNDMPFTMWRIRMSPENILPIHNYYL